MTAQAPVMTETRLLGADMLSQKGLVVPKLVRPFLAAKCFFHASSMTESGIVMVAAGTNAGARECGCQTGSKWGGTWACRGQQGRGSSRQGKLRMGDSFKQTRHLHAPLSHLQVPHRDQYGVQVPILVAIIDQKQLYGQGCRQWGEGREEGCPVSQGPLQLPRWSLPPSLLQLQPTSGIMRRAGSVNGGERGSLGGNIWRCIPF